LSAVGIFGGTFDPVHYGHLRAALEVKECFGLEDFRLLPAGTPLLRGTPGAAAEHRLAMLQLAASIYPEFRVDDREIRRGGCSYMVDTLAEIRREQGNVPVLLVIGQDAANALDSWHEWQQLFELSHLVVMRRPDSTVRYSETLQQEMRQRLVTETGQLLDSAAGFVYPQEITQLDISATAIRHMLKSGRSPGYLMPDVVIEYIHRNGLYQA